MNEHGTVARYDGGGCRCGACREAVRLRSRDRGDIAQVNGGVYPGPITHGASGYRNYGCRCELCTTAHAAGIGGVREARRAATAANGGVAPVAVHNASTYANWGCRCDDCRGDVAAYARQSRPSRAGAHRKS